MPDSNRKSDNEDGHEQVLDSAIDPLDGSTVGLLATNELYFFYEYCGWLLWPVNRHNSQ